MVMFDFGDIWRVLKFWALLGYPDITGRINNGDPARDRECSSCPYEL